MVNSSRSAVRRPSEDETISTVPQDPKAAGARTPRYLEPGSHTAYGTIVPYRLDKIAKHGVLSGAWLDCGCAEGGYTTALARYGADQVVGIEPNEELIRRAEDQPHPSSVTYRCASAEALPFPENSFDGVLLNEVLEHVADEELTLREIWRVLRPAGHLALFSPNRWFPFEGHGLRIDARRSIGCPVPLMPWLPDRLTQPFATARNYWPSKLRSLVRRTGFDIVEAGWALPQFEVYVWLPKRVIARYRRGLPRIERSPAARLAAVSTFILARKADIGMPLPDRTVYSATIRVPRFRTRCKAY